MPPSPLTLRDATAADARIIAQLHTLSWQTAYSHILPADYLSADAPAEHLEHWTHYLNRSEDEWGFVRIAERDGTPVGFVSAEKSADPARGVLLDCLHVHPDHRGGGAGTQMIDAVRAWARSLGEPSVHLFVLEHNARAIRFYERNGWECVGSESSYIGATPVTDWIYTISA